jgi:thiamine pyrophosphokinase
MPAEGTSVARSNPPPPEDFHFVQASVGALERGLGPQTVDPVSEELFDGTRAVSGIRVLIFANGVLPDLAAAKRLLRPDDVLICADGGLEHARALGLSPSLLIGDLDSLPAEAPASPAPGEMTIKRFPRDKNETDLELALDTALQYDPASIVIMAGLGARTDHTLASISLLSNPRLIGRDCRLDDGVEEVLLCQGRAAIQGEAGDLVSLIPWGAPAVGVRTHGLKWQLEGETLYSDRSRGLSNEMLEDRARIEVESGRLLIVHRRQGVPLSR